LYDKYAEKVELSNKVKQVKKDIQNAQSVMHLDELKNRKRALRRLGFTNELDVVQIKARVACEISTGDELVLSELLFNNFFTDMAPEQVAAILSVFIFEEKSKEDPKIPNELMKPFRDIQAQARAIAKVSQECKLVLNEEEYVKSFRPELINVTYAWTKGAPFKDIWYVNQRSKIVTNTI
jgi:ATP-dependent RNA helicase DOB1